jgi:hypothetical protein
MPNADKKVIVIPIANNGFSGRDLIPALSKAISEQPASVISIEQRVARAPEVVSNWKELHCKLTLDQVRIFTDLVRAVTVLLEQSHEHEYGDVLAQIDSRLAKILSRYPGSEFHFNREHPGKDEFRVCNIGLIPVTDEGFDFIDGVYHLLKEREDELKAEKKRKEDELNALLPKDPLPPGNVFCVEIRYTPNKNYRECHYCVWAENEAAAEQKALVKFHAQFPAKNYSFNITKIEIERRGSWRWNWYFQHEGGKCE